MRCIDVLLKGGIMNYERYYSATNTHLWLFGIFAMEGMHANINAEYTIDDVIDIGKDAIIDEINTYYDSIDAEAIKRGANVIGKHTPLFENQIAEKLTDEVEGKYHAKHFTIKTLADSGFFQNANHKQLDYYNEISFEKRIVDTSSFQDDVSIFKDFFKCIDYKGLQQLKIENESHPKFKVDQVTEKNYMPLTLLGIVLGYFFSPGKAFSFDTTLMSFLNIALIFWCILALVIFVGYAQKNTWHFYRGFFTLDWEEWRQRIYDFEVSNIHNLTGAPMRNPEKYNLERNFGNFGGGRRALLSILWQPILGGIIAYYAGSFINPIIQQFFSVM